MTIFKNDDTSESLSKSCMEIFEAAGIPSEETQKGLSVLQKLKDSVLGHEYDQEEEAPFYFS